MNNQTIMAENVYDFLAVSVTVVVMEIATRKIDK